MTVTAGYPTFVGVVYPDQADHMGHINVRHYVGMFDHATWVFFAAPRYIHTLNAPLLFSLSSRL